MIIFPAPGWSLVINSKRKTLKQQDVKTKEITMDNRRARFIFLLESLVLSENDGVSQFPENCSTFNHDNAIGDWKPHVIIRSRSSNVTQHPMFLDANRTILMANEICFSGRQYCAIETSSRVVATQ